MNAMSTPAQGESVETGEAPTQVSSANFVPAARKYWMIAKRNLWLIAGVVALAIIMAVIATLLMTPQYTAMARIEVSRQQDNVTNVQTVEREESSPSQEFYATQYSLLDTRSLAQRVAQRLNLSQSDAFFAAHGKSAEDLFGGDGAAPTAAEAGTRSRETADLLLENVTIAPIRGSALIDVMYTSADPILSARIANVWVEEFARQAQDRRFGSTSEARKFLEQRLAELRQRLEESERELVNYAADENIVRLSESRSEDGRTRTTQTLTSSDLESLNAALAEATAARIAAEAQLVAVSRSSANSQSVENVALNQLRERRAQLAAQYADLLVKFEPQYPAAQALQRQIETIDSSIAREEGRVRQSVRTNYDAARQREDQLRQRVNGLLGELTSENRASIQYNIYQREVDTNRELYDALLQRYKEIGAAGVGFSNIAIVDRANVPERPSSPKLLLNLAVALLLGGIAAAAAVLVVENLDESIRDPEELRKKIKRPVLGVIPYLEGIDEPLVELKDPKSELSEAYMTLRTNLSFSTPNGVPKTLMVTSSQAAEGKSTTSLALANLLARNGRRVVLVDLDMRRPMIDRMIGGPRDFGMSNYLSGNSDLDALLQETDNPNLTFISAGPIPPSAAELLSSVRLGQLLEKLGQGYDHVIIDSAPVLGLSDAPLIARSVEGVVLAVQANDTPARSVEHAVNRLEMGNAHILGVVLTKFRAKDSTYGYGYGFDYKYGEKNDQALANI